MVERFYLFIFGKGRKKLVQEKDNKIEHPKENNRNLREEAAQQTTPHPFWEKKTLNRKNNKNDDECPE